MRRGLVPAALALAAAAAAPLGGCADPAKEVSFEAPDPAARIRALKVAGRTEDRRAIPDLIQTLDSEDPMQRMVAIRTLEKMTGQTLGYEHAAPWWERNEAVERWVDWAHEQGLAPHPRGADVSREGPGVAPVNTPSGSPGGENEAETGISNGS